MRTTARLRRRRGENQTGAAAIEMVLIAPILAMFVFGIIYFGILLASILGTNNSAREGARFGVVAQRTCADVAGQVRASLLDTVGVTWPVTMDVSLPSGSKCSGVSIPRTGSISATTTQVCLDSDTSNDALRVLVRTSTGVSIPFLFSKNFAVTGKGEYRCEYS